LAKDNFKSKIGAGIYKNKTILIPKTNKTRSTKALVKDSFFDTLQQDIFDKVFIEAFGGSGLMGLEALSRGAKKAYFVEILDESFKTLQKNINSIAPKSSYAVKGDTFKITPSLIEKISDETILYLDPPFDIRESMSDIYDKVINLVKNIDSKNIYLITIEHSSKIKFDDKIGVYKKIKSKKFGKTTLSYYSSI
jgi:16S rRNA (guanine(966)-N(2))-methyltransferase RsmD